MWPRVGISVMNRRVDSIAPTLLSAVIAANGLTIVMTYDEDLDTGSVPSTDAYSLAGTSSAMSSVGIVGPVVTLTVDVAIFNFQIVFIDYTAGTNPIRDIAENNAANLTNQSTTNNSTITHPSEMDNGDTVKWFDYLVNVTEVVGVSEWDNAEALTGIIAGALLQATELDQPTLSFESILFGGTRQFLKTAGFTFAQPEFLYIVLKTPTWRNTAYILDGNNANTGVFWQNGTTPGVKIYAGAASDENNNLTIDNWGIVRIHFNGASSSLQINETTIWTGDAGSADMGGLTLGVDGALGSFANIEVKEIILRKSALGESGVYSYLKDKYPYFASFPAGYNPAIEYEWVMFMHGNGGCYADLPTTWTASLLAEDFIVVQGCGGNNWGNEEHQQAYINIYNRVRNDYKVAEEVVILDNSMGGLAGLNIMRGNKIPVKAGIQLISMVDLTDAYGQIAFTAAIEAAYNFSGAGNLAAAIDGYNPYDEIIPDGGDGTFATMPPLYWLHGEDDVTALYSLAVELDLAVASTQDSTMLSVAGVGHTSSISTQPRIDTIITWLLGIINP